MPYFKDKNNTIHFLEDSKFSILLPIDCFPITNEEAAEMLKPTDQATLAALTQEAKNNRAVLLLNADIQINKLEDNNKNTTNWRNYRQNLRDITKQTNFPYSITWPEVPHE